MWVCYMVSLSALTLLVGSQQGHLAHEEPVPLINKGSLLEQVAEENLGTS